MPLSARLLLVFLLGLQNGLAQLPYAQDRLIIQWQSTRDFNVQQCLERQVFGHSQVDALTQRWGPVQIQRTGNPHHKRTYRLNFPNPIPIESVITAFEQTGLFEFVEPDYIGFGCTAGASLDSIPDDPFFHLQYQCLNTGINFDTLPMRADADMDMELAWELETGSDEVVIALLDSGVKLDHPDLRNRLWSNPLDTLDGIDNDNNGYIDDYQGWNFISQNNNPNDRNGHGTQMMSLMAAEANNQMGLAGIDWHCRVMNCQVLNRNNSGMHSWWAEGLYYATEMGADIINLSLGGGNSSQLLEEAIQYASERGVVLVAGMGNFNTDLPFYPAAYPETIAVGATNAVDQRAAPFFQGGLTGSNYNNYIDVVAPGDYLYALSHEQDTFTYLLDAGTSQACAMVSGVCGLLLAQDTSRSAADIREILQATAEDQVGDPAEDTPGFDIYYGYGRVNAHQALLYSSIDPVDPSHTDDLPLLLFPNPARDYLYIQGATPEGTVEVYNGLGQNALSLHPGPSGEVDVSALPDGWYLVRYSPAEGSSREAPFIKH